MVKWEAHINHQGLVYFADEVRKALREEQLIVREQSGVVFLHGQAMSPPDLLFAVTLILSGLLVEMRGRLGGKIEEVAG